VSGNPPAAACGAGRDKVLRAIDILRQEGIVFTVPRRHLRQPRLQAAGPRIAITRPETRYLEELLAELPARISRQPSPARSAH
jgi:hypothetical protein